MVGIKLNIIEWIDDDNSKEVIVYLNDKKIEIYDWNKKDEHNGVEIEINKENISEVKWCIENNMEYLNHRIFRLSEKLKRKKEARVLIKDGYKISSKLSTEQKKSVKNRINAIKEEIKFLNSINLNDLINGPI